MRLKGYRRMIMGALGIGAALFGGLEGAELTGVILAAIAGFAVPDNNEKKVDTPPEGQEH